MSLCAGIAVICLTAGSLKAQYVGVEGSFSLPFETHWGMAVLPAGDYAFAMDSTTRIIAITQGTKHIGMVLAQAFTPASSSGASSMTIVGRRVRSLHLAVLGLTYNFPGHKGESEFLAA
ncbi:MAG: hypothetical protein ACRD4O_07730, partial [Bryobacteraceae bacterium]